MFILKKIISGILCPLPFSLFLSFLGLYFLWFTSKQRAGKILVSAGLVILTLFSYGVVSDKLLRSLERRYDTLEIKNSSALLNTGDKSNIKFVVVLGGGHTSDPELPLLSRINNGSLVRLIEGIRIYRKYPGTKLILSGGGVNDPFSEAEVMAQVAEEMGVPDTDIILESKSKDTKDEARFIKPMVGGEPFVLVTTASHIPRSMALFKKLGMNPVPCPVGHSIKDGQKFGFFSFFPDADNIHKAELAIHEYLGMTWAKLRGQR